MANEQNLKPFKSENEAREKGKKGGKKSAQVRREKKAVRALLDEALQMRISEVPQIAKLAAKMGVESTKSVKEIFVLVSLLNSFKSADLNDLDKLKHLLGEQDETANNGILEQLAEYLGGAKSDESKQS